MQTIPHRSSHRTLRASLGAAILAFASSGASLAIAAPQDAPAPDDAGNAFCTSAASELLAALDGTWSLKQGAGVALGATGAGMAGTPLPPHPAQPLKLKYDADRGLAVLTSPDAPDRMIMFPVASEQAEQAASAIEQAQAAAGDCDWQALPIMVGTNRYALDREASTEMRGGSAGAYFCGLIGMSGIIPPAPVMRACSPVGIEPAHGQMTMTLLVRFQSPDSGSGMLYFRGEMQGSHFAAQAPVQLSR